MTDLDKLEALEKAATRGPWEVLDYGPNRPLEILGGPGPRNILEVYSADEKSSEELASAEFIAAIRNAAPELLKEFRELRARVVDCVAGGRP